MNNQLSHPEQRLTLAQKNVQPWLTNFTTCWSNLVTPDVKTAIKANLPALRDYPKIIGEQAAYIALHSWLAIIIAEVSDFFNVGKNMSKTQIAMTAELIVENYAHLTLADFKACFRKAMASGKLFDRLDGNIICSWLNNYDKERDVALAKLYEAQDRDEYQPPCAPSGISFAEFKTSIEKRALEGDAEAKAILNNIAAYESLKKDNSDNKHQKDMAFRQWYLTDYLKKHHEP